MNKIYRIKETTYSVNIGYNGMYSEPSDRIYEEKIGYKIVDRLGKLALDAIFHSKEEAEKRLKVINKEKKIRSKIKNLKYEIVLLDKQLRDLLK